MNRIDQCQSSDNCQLSKKQVEILDQGVAVVGAPGPVEDQLAQPALCEVPT